MTEPSLEERANAARIGSRREMERFLEALRPVVARWAVVLTGGPDPAEDVVQAVLVRIHCSIESYSPSGKVTAWAYWITRSAAANAARKEQRHRDHIGRITRDGVAAWLSERSDALELLGAVDELKRFMADLSPQQRAVYGVSAKRPIVWSPEGPIVDRLVREFLATRRVERTAGCRL